ncbi:hypothetical protein QBC43DRAFT_207496 [Cladorrhinum sp. PSN259]|nr:hypothetical protein QBC43DRAFT_207496 [Cladorrhinum sp. PSN259]
MNSSAPEHQPGPHWQHYNRPHDDPLREPGTTSSAPGSQPQHRPRSRPSSNAIQSGVDLHLMELSALRQTWIEDKGNVLAVVTFPKNEYPKPHACDGQTWEEDLRIRMSYDKLMCLGSSKISAMFRPRAQERFRRRLGIDKLPDGINYVLDFTPPTEGPELADLTAMLWLPRMVKLWFLAGHYVPKEILATGNGLGHRPMADKAVGCVLTLGHDDVCKSDNCLRDLCEWGTKADVPGIINEDPLIYTSHIPQFRKIDDYCPIRHRVAIMRVLRAINGHGLLLNSAVRMWTVAQVAISLEVSEVVVDPIMQWLTAPPNTKFLEICPEKAFQLAYGLKIPNVLIASFKILVNETAIDYAATHPSPRLPSTTWAQRRRDDYGDLPSDPVEYGSRAFLERISNKLHLLRSDNVFELLSSNNPELDKLRNISSLIEDLKDPHPLKTAYQTMTKALVYAFRRTLDSAFSIGPNNNQTELIMAQRCHYLSFRGCTAINELYARLNEVQKAVTPFFWRNLRNLDLSAECLDESFEGHALRHHIAVFNEELWQAVTKKEISDPRNRFANIGSACGFIPFKFFSFLTAAVRDFCHRVLDRDNDKNFPFFLSDHLLLSLEESELKYLPIWADGLDDESGGVFQEVIPPAEMGPSEPGPAYHTGYTIASRSGTDTDMSCYASTIAPSDLGVSGLGLDDATVARSLSAQQSVSAVSDGPGPNTRRVVAAPSEISSEQFTEDDIEYAEAAFNLPSAHQPQGQALARYVDGMSSSSSSSVTSSSSVVGEDFAHVPDQGGDMMQFSDDDDGTSTLDGFEELDPWSADI